VADVRDRMLSLVRPTLPYVGDIAVGLAIAALIATIVLMAGRPSQFIYIDF
jgi:hypothetical protein